MKTLFRRVYFCWLRDRHWTMTFHGYWPSCWAHCSCCGALIMGPHEDPFVGVNRGGVLQYEIRNEDFTRRIELIHEAAAYDLSGPKTAGALIMGPHELESLDIKGAAR
jgi:hypothetical protein